MSFYNFKEDKMTLEIKTISTHLILNNYINCYLIKTDTGFILIDTGRASKRTKLEKELESAGCQPGNLKLIVLTHGDFDHTGNAAYLRKKFGTRIAMHYDDSGMAERGDMFWNRKNPNVLIRIMFDLFFGLRKSDRFKPDLYIEDGYDLSGYEFGAKVLHLPGHSKGSIGILTADGNLFCGDLFMNMNQPAPTSLVDDLAELNSSIGKLKSLKINTVYPGHGKSFPMSSFTQ
jgi:glyoxylase-like metal-dependent hydrolase (beta-lactamase superfamily II)